MTIEELYEVPAYDQLELLTYLVENKTKATVHLLITSGHILRGIPISIKKSSDHETLVRIYTKNDHDQSLDTVSQVRLSRIEAVEFMGNDTYDLIEVLSKGERSKQKVYGESGRLQVAKAFKALSQDLLDKTNLQIEGPEMELPKNKNQLNRILQLTEIIKGCLVDLLLEDDARQSFSSKFSKLTFENHSELQIVKTQDSLVIRYPYTDLLKREIDPKEFEEQLLRVL